MTDVAELLDAIVPRYEGTGDWNRVLRDARAERRPQPLRRRTSLRLGAALALVGAIAAVAALWPAGGTGPTVLERALAATGDGQVLHLVYESDRPFTLVDLETGERTELRSQNEVWFDPGAGLRETERFHGVVQFDTFLAAGELHEHTRSVYTGLGADYREALASGRAEVVGEETVDGTAVYWIRIEPPRGPGSDGAHDVAISRESFEPVYVRITQAGAPALTRIVAYETVPAGSAPLEATTLDAAPPGPAAPGDEVELAAAAEILGRDAVWAGEQLDGLTLDSARELSLGADGRGLSLLYQAAGGDPAGAHVEISEAATPASGLTMLAGVRGYAPPEGTVLLAGTTALLRSHGLVVAIHALDEETTLAAARALRPYGAS